MRIHQYDDYMRADDFVHEERVKKLKALKEKKIIRPLNLERLPQQNDVEVK